ncbi:Retrovirus-related Pol polyprotein from transposon 297 [Araneus ventricosus]|uniref:Retrovirus-related Pol polyprotein from transposon 297 n=1 Tax=Araneus ventricosus TaxID=182803 RepID=A0A4Y2F233_ARAVE|nr:Retrovirus-related Pol polyprotein from transposon 297 [Araneus ventricosus]
MSKIFESIIHKRLFHQVKNLISPSQHGFIPKRSTATNLFCLTNKIISSFQIGSQLDVIYTDFSKAFDSIDFGILLNKLHGLGFHVNQTDWLHSYLCNRSLYVYFNNAVSREFSGTSGVPQGSNLGLLLFILFINDLTSVFKYFECLLFADDLKLFSSMNSNLDAVLLQSDLDCLFKWCTVNKLHLNIEKCSILSYTRKSQPLNHVYKINDLVSSRSDSVTDLGIIFDTKLDFSQHINSMVSKAYRRLGILKRKTKEFSSEIALKVLYYAHVRSSLEYCSIIWDSIYRNKIEIIERIQNNFLRYWLYKKNGIYLQDVSSSYLRDMFNIPSLCSRRDISCVLFFYKGNIKIDDFNCKADICVVENNVMSYDVIVGMNVLMQGETVINENGIVIKEKFQRIEEVDSLSALPIDVTPNKVELNIGPDVPNIFKDKAQQSIFNYVLHKTKTTDVELNILVKSNEPISHQPRRLPFSEKKIVLTQVAEWLEQGIVEPCSSEYSSPVVIVRKKNGTPRVCIDYRRLNKVVVKDRFPLPLIEDILGRLQVSRVFSTIDLKNAFFHVNVNKDSRKYTSFVPHEGQYQFLKIPFGLCNSPAVFQRYINTIFRPLINDGIVLPYLDDIIILSSSFEEGIERVECVLSIASENGLEINFNKSHFLKKRIKFLGHVIKEG